MRNLLRFLGIVGVLAFVPGGELLAKPRTFVAGQGVRMKVEVPPGYSFKSQTNAQGLTLVEMDNPVWKIQLRVLISPEYTAEAETEEWQKDIVVNRSADFLAQSKEQDYKFLPLSPAQGSGVYCVFTDPEAKTVDQLKPDEFMHVVVGAKVIRGAAMYFQIYNNDVKSEEFREVFDLLVNGFDEA